jgi:hypothetical protein
MRRPPFQEMVVIDVQPLQIKKDQAAGDRAHRSAQNPEILKS